MLDALVVAGPAAAAAASALAPQQLRELGVDPSLLSVMESRSPYRLRVLLQKVCRGLKRIRRRKTSVAIFAGSQHGRPETQ